MRGPRPSELDISTDSRPHQWTNTTQLGQSFEFVSFFFTRVGMCLHYVYAHADMFFLTSLLLLTAGQDHTSQCLPTVISSVDVELCHSGRHKPQDDNITTICYSREGVADSCISYSADSSYLRRQRNRVMPSPQLSKHPSSVSLLDECSWEIELS